MTRDIFLRYDSLDDLAQRRRLDNPKGHDLGAIEASLDQFAYITPVVVNDADDGILEGHGRVEALLKRQARGEPPPAGVQVDREGRWLVPTVHGPELSAAEAKAFVVAANRTTILGGWVEQGEVLRAMELFAERVMPRFV